MLPNLNITLLWRSPTKGTVQSKGYDMKQKIFRVISAIFFVLIMGKESEGQESKSPSAKPVNIVVILDTSDRVSKEKNPDQADTDVEIAKNLVQSYYEGARRKMFSTQNRLAFVVPDQPKIPPISREIIKKLKIWPTKEDRRVGEKAFTPMKAELLVAIDQLYQLLETQQEFTGSDIWGWFRASGAAYLKKDMQNYIICLSDGYLDFNRSIQDRRPKRGNKTSYIPYTQVVRFRNDPSWEQKFDSEGHGMLEIKKDFSSYNVKFLMVEIKLRHMLDLPILEKYWQTWLGSMGINSSEFVESQPDSQIVQEKITAFISQNQ